VPMKEEAVTSTVAEGEVPKTDPSAFKNVPLGAGQRLAALKDTLAKRRYGDLRPQLAEGITWSLGGGPGADAAMAMWQADPAVFDAMATTLGQCASDGEQKVKCGNTTPGGYQLELEVRGDSWKVTSFVKLE